MLDLKETLVKYGRDEYPFLDMLLRIYLTCPVTSCSAERTFSALRRLKTYLQTTMLEDRWCDIGVCNVNKDMLRHEVDHKDVMETFISKNNNRRTYFGEKH